MKSNQKSEKSIKSVIQKTDIWKNFIKFSSIFVICLALTLAGVKIPAKADDYYVRWYTSSQNPLTMTGFTVNYLGSALSDTWESDLGKYGYVEFFQTIRLTLQFNGFTTGYTYLYAPIYNFNIDYTNVYPTGFSLDSIDLDSFEFSNSNISSVDVIYTRTNNDPTKRFFQVRCRWDWFTSISTTPQVIGNIRFKVRYYCGNANAVNLNVLGSYNMQGTVSQEGNTTLYGAYIANFSPLQIDLGQYQQFLIANNYLDSIATAIAPSSPPDPVVTEAETKASEAEELQEEEESLREELESYFDENALDDVFEDEIEPMFQDAGIGAGLVFWKDWVNHHFNKGYNDGEHFSSTLSIVFNIMARLWK